MTNSQTLSGLINQLPSTILDWIHYWLRKKPLWTLARTTSPPARLRPVNNSCTKGVTCSEQFRETTEQIAHYQSPMKIPHRQITSLGQ